MSSHHRKTNRLRVLVVFIGAAVIGFMIVAVLLDTEPGAAAVSPPAAASLFSSTVVSTSPLADPAPPAPFVADTPQAQMVIDTLNSNGMNLTSQESETVLWIANAEVVKGGFVAGRQALIRAEVIGLLPRLTTLQIEQVVDCVVKYNDMILELKSVQG